MENKCEQQGFSHAWQMIENNLVYLTNPPSFPPKERICINCGKKQTLQIIQTEQTEWRDNN